MSNLWSSYYFLLILRIIDTSYSSDQSTTSFTLKKDNIFWHIQDWSSLVVSGDDHNNSYKVFLR